MKFSFKKKNINFISQIINLNHILKYLITSNILYKFGQVEKKDINSFI